MSIPATIVDKLRNYEYEKRGCGDAVGDIYALIHHISVLEEEIDDLRVEAREKDAWEGRYNALLEECEASRPPEIDGGEASRGAADRTVAIDARGCPWARVDPGCWFPLRIDADSEVLELPEEAGPYTIVYTPGGEMTPWEMLMSGNDEIIPIRVIDFDADLIAEYLAPACPDSHKPGENSRI